MIWHQDFLLLGFDGQINQGDVRNNYFDEDEVSPNLSHKLGPREIIQIDMERKHELEQSW